MVKWTYINSILKYQAEEFSQNRMGKFKENMKKEFRNMKN